MAMTMSSGTGIVFAGGRASGVVGRAVAERLERGSVTRRVIIVHEATTHTTTATMAMLTQQQQQQQQQKVKE